MLKRSILDLLLSLPQFSLHNVETPFVEKLMFLFTPLYLDRVDYVKAKCYHYYLLLLFFFHLQAESLPWKHCLENGIIYTAHFTKIQVDLINDSLIRMS